MGRRILLANTKISQLWRWPVVWSFHRLVPERFVLIITEVFIYTVEWMIFKNGQREKMLKYFFDPKEREYRPEISLYTQWKWTRHFLASKGGEGEWAVEGEVPEPVIMFLQMIRYSRLGYRRVTEYEEIVGIPDKSESRVFEFQPPAPTIPEVSLSEEDSVGDSIVIRRLQ
jgi:hypothetical protein